MTTSPVMSVNDELVAELEALASKATGGDWEYRLGLIRTMPDADGYVPIAVAPNSPKNWRGQRDTNMHYIATSNPATILALLAERAELKRDRERYQKLRTVTPYRFKKIQDSAITDGGDVFYFHSDKFDAGLDASSDGLAHEDKQ